MSEREKYQFVIYAFFCWFLSCALTGGQTHNCDVLGQCPTNWPTRLGPVLTSYDVMLELNRGTSMPKPCVREAHREAGGLCVSVAEFWDWEKPSDPGFQWEAVLCMVLDYGYSRYVCAPTTHIVKTEWHCREDKCETEKVTFSKYLHNCSLTFTMRQNSARHWRLNKKGNTVFPCKEFMALENPSQESICLELSFPEASP